MATSTFLKRYAVFLMFITALASCGRSDLSRLMTEPSKRFWPVTEPADSQLDQGHALFRYMNAAKARELPLNFFRELIRLNAAVSVIEGDWPTYQPGVLYGGTISMPSAGRPESWTNGEWSSFYNELFHAWYGLVFSRESKYSDARSKIWTEERMNHYRKAHPADPKLAQEDAWSETVASVMIQLAPLRMDGQLKYPDFEKFSYSIGRTVAPVSHSDRPGYTPEAENTYPAEWEYHDLFLFLTSMAPPPAQK